MSMLRTLLKLRTLKEIRELDERAEQRKRSVKLCPCGCGRERPLILLTHSFDGTPFKRPPHLKLEWRVEGEPPKPLYVGDDYPRIAHRFEGDKAAKP